MKRTTTLLAALVTGLLAASSVQASPFLFLDQLLGSADALSGDQDSSRRMTKIRRKFVTNRQDQTGGHVAGNQNGGQHRTMQWGYDAKKHQGGD